MRLLSAILFLTPENNDLRHFSTPLMILAIVLVLFFAWRVWRFTIEPMMKPGEPRELPYWIPCERFGRKENLSFCPIYFTNHLFVM